MSLFVRGVRVVRGRDWLWGNDDGGIGNVGTVISLTANLNSYGLRIVTVAWDSGYKSHYRTGPCCYDLSVSRLYFKHILMQ